MAVISFRSTSYIKGEDARQSGDQVAIRIPALPASAVFFAYYAQHSRSGNYSALRGGRTPRTTHTMAHTLTHTFPVWYGSLAPRIVAPNRQRTESWP